MLLTMLHHAPGIEPKIENPMTMADPLHLLYGLGISFWAELSHFMGARKKWRDGVNDSDGQGPQGHGNGVYGKGKDAGPFYKEWARFTRKFRDSDPQMQAVETLVDFHLSIAGEQARRYHNSLGMFAIVRKTEV